MQMPCEVCYKDATRVCSACKYTRYCSYVLRSGQIASTRLLITCINTSRREACQKANWKIHKKGCEIQQMLNRMNDEHAAAPRSRPNPKRCTGCNVRFTEDYPCDGECPDCGYVACESCICDNNNGTVHLNAVRKALRAQFDDRDVLLPEFQFRQQVLPDGAAVLPHGR